MLTSRSPVFLDLSSLFYCALTRSYTPSPLAQPNVSKPQGGRQPGRYPVLLQLDSASASLRIKSGQWNRLGSFWGKSLRKMGFVWGGRVAERAREIPFIQVFFTFTFRYLREPPAREYRRGHTMTTKQVIIMQLRRISVLLVVLMLTLSCPSHSFVGPQYPQQSRVVLVSAPDPLSSESQLHAALDERGGSNEDTVSAARRTALKSFLALSTFAGISFSPVPASAAAAEEASLPSLRQRVEGGVSAPSTYVIESPDVFYPDWFNGVWSTESTTLSVEAPAGIALFGGNRSYQAALDDVGQSIQYETRFRLAPSTGPSRSAAAAAAASAPVESKSLVVADREFNIASIIRSTMGKQAVLDVPTGQSDDPNRIVFILSPAGANGTIFRAELRATGRHIEQPPPSEVVAADAAASSSSGGDGGGNARFSASSSSSSSSSSPPLPPLPPPPASLGVSFDVLEAVRQVVTAERSAAMPMSTPTAPPLVKDIETTTLYTKISDDRIEALQRTASFLVASTNSDPLKAAAIQRMGGRAVDIRNYKVVYTLKRRLSSGA